MSEDFVRGANAKEIQPPIIKSYDFAGERECVVNIEGNYYAIGNVCTHLRGALNEGTLEGFDVECP